MMAWIVVVVLSAGLILVKPRRIRAYQVLLGVGVIALLWGVWIGMRTNTPWVATKITQTNIETVSYTHLTLPTNREV